MKVCPSCGRENVEDARFCSNCATPFETGAVPREERKVVTCLFCDLVGFTARAEVMDPEDVRRLLQPYHALVRTELERFGSTVEKFVGDAVMASSARPWRTRTIPSEPCGRGSRFAMRWRTTSSRSG